MSAAAFDRASLFGSPDRPRSYATDARRDPLGKNPGILLGAQHPSLPGFDARKSASQNTKNSSALPGLTKQEVMRECQVIALSMPMKVAAEKADVTPRAIENVRNGESAFSLHSFLNLCRQDPRTRALAMRLMGCQGETDPEFVEGITLLYNQLQRRQQSAALEDSPSVNCPGGDGATTGDFFEGDRS